MSGAVNDKEMARKTLNRKGSHYGQMDKPFVVALLCMSSFMEDNDIEQALFGSLACDCGVTRTCGVGLALSGS
jgi:hypothetical protein